MIIDAKETDLPPLAERYDVCIAGGGVAGIVLAASLVKRRNRVLLLEGGGLDYSDESQEFYRGQSVGAPYFDLTETRLRFLGGSSNHWGGNCRPYDPIDYEARAWIPDSGWPIDISDVQPYLEEACEILEIPMFGDELKLEGSQGRLQEFILHESPPVLFGYKYRDFLADHADVHVLLNANLVDIELNPERGDVAAFVFRGYGEGAAARRAQADKFILALGGIETPRLLLNANRQIAQGLGNEAGLVGRYFMEHPHTSIGYYVAAQETASGLNLPWICPSVDVLREQGIGNAHFELGEIEKLESSKIVHDLKRLMKSAVCASDIVADYVRTMRSLRCRANIPAGSGLLYAIAEQVPNPKSRIFLSDERDQLGLRRVVVDWQLTPVDAKTLRVGGLEIGKFLARTEIGRVKLFDWVLDEDDLDGFYSFSGVVHAGHHHMGTTRMGFSKEDGVVDRNCRVFGVDNLYIAGSSTFRTSGHSNPTLMIVQLALRLADHLASMGGSAMKS